jgi:hypothetical protein
MSDVDTALTGAEVAPVVPETTETQTAPESTPEQLEAQKQERERDEKGRFVPQERLNEVTRHRREAERRADALERELAQYRNQQPAHQPQSEGPPSLEAFGYDTDKWQAALADHVSKQAITRAEQLAQQREQQRNQQQIADTFEKRSREFSATTPDFEDRLTDLSRAVQFNPYVVEAIGASDHGPAVAYYLAQHLDEADSISRLPAHIAALHIGRIEAKVSATKPKPVTNAPNPAPTLGGGAAVTKDPEKMGVDDWLEWRNSQLKKR